MGKKYIIELLDDCQSEFKGIMVFGLTQEKQISVELIPEESLRPYTEPDLEQIRKEAYEQGYKKCLSEHDFDSPCVSCDKYQQGLTDAWEAARKIWEYDTTTLRKIFGDGIMRMDWFMKFTASEAIEKLKAYKQGAEIRVGDVVRVKNAPEVEIWVTDISDEDGGLLSGLALKTVDDNCNMGDTYANRNIYNFERTGKHYDVSTVIEKMREGQDG